MEGLKILLIAVFGVLLAVWMKQYKPEYGIYIALLISILVLLETGSRLGILLQRLEELESTWSGERQYFRILYKAIGMTCLCEFCSNICKDAGFQGLAGQIEIFGKALVLICGMPVIFAVVDMLRQFAL